MSSGVAGAGGACLAKGRAALERPLCIDGQAQDAHHHHEHDRQRHCSSHSWILGRGGHVDLRPFSGPAHGVPGQPTLPSIWSSINRLHSTAYSIGSVRVTGSMKPLTIMLIACCSERPRLIR